MKRMFALLFLALSVTANAAVVDVSTVDGGFVMLTDEHAPNGMPLFRSFKTDGSMVEAGGYVPNYTGYTLHTRHGEFAVKRGNGVYRRMLRDALDYRCRGDSGDDPKTQRACQLRDQLEF